MEDVVANLLPVEGAAEERRGAPGRLARLLQAFAIEDLGRHLDGVESPVAVGDHLPPPVEVEVLDEAGRDDDDQLRAVDLRDVEPAGRARVGRVDGGWGEDEERALTLVGDDQFDVSHGAFLGGREE